MRTRIGGGDTRCETALAVIPKNELAVVAKSAKAKADKLQKIGARVIYGGLSGYALTTIGVCVAIHFAPVVVPVLAGVSLASFLGIPIGSLIDSRSSKARRLERKAVEKRADRLTEAARAALEGAVQDGTIRVGLDLRIEPQDETPKKVHVDGMKATIDEDGKKNLSISARLFEANGTSIVEGLIVGSVFGTIGRRVSEGCPRLDPGRDSVH